jgi:hypothetical protein
MTIEFDVLVEIPRGSRNKYEVPPTPFRRCDADSHQGKSIPGDLIDKA